MPSSPRLVCLLAALLLLPAALPLAAKTFTYPPEKCHCDVPDDWTEKDSPGNKLSAINADETKSFTLRTVEVGPDLTLDNAAFIKGFEESIVKNGFTITNRSHAPLGGIDAYVVDCTQSMPAGPVTTRIMTTIANGYAYGINVAKLKGNPMDDSELAAAVNSFGFIGTPELPHPGDDQAGRYGYLVGIVIGVTVPLLIIARLRKRRG